MNIVYPSTKSQGNALRIFEFVFSIFSLVHLSNAIMPLILTKGADEGDGVNIMSFDLSLIAKISTLIYLITFILLILRWKKLLSALATNKFLLILMGIVCFSCFWSINPAQTFRFSFYAVGTTAFGLYLASRYSLSQQMDLLGWTYGSMLILSILVAVAMPQYGLMAAKHEGALRGVFTHKNMFGTIMAPSGVIFFLNALRGQKYSWIYWGLLTLSFAAMVMSQSTTSIAIVCVMLLLCFVYRIFRWRYEVLISAVLTIAFVSFALLIWILGYVGLDSLFGLVGKDATLTGRTDIWRYVWDQIEIRPWLGYGLAAFWNGFDGPSGYVQLAMRTEVIYAHNGFLDIWLSIGIVGLGTFVFNFVSNTLQSLSLLRMTNTPEGIWPLLFFTYIFLANLTEGIIGNFGSSIWVIYVALSYSLVMAKSNYISNL